MGEIGIDSIIFDWREEALQRVGSMLADFCSFEREAQEDVYQNADTSMGLCFRNNSTPERFDNSLYLEGINTQYHKDLGTISSSEISQADSRFLVDGKTVRAFDLASSVKKLFSEIDELEQKTERTVSVSGLDYFRQFKTASGKVLDLGIGKVYHTHGSSSRFNEHGKIENINHIELKREIVNSSYGAVIVKYIA